MAARSTDRDELVKAVVGALGPAQFKLPYKARGDRAEDARPIRASRRDLLLAFGRAPRLGQIAWRAKWAQERDAVTMLAGALHLVAALEGKRSGNLRRPRHSETMMRIAATAFAEWVESDCQACNGTGVHGGRRLILAGDEQRLSCPACHGAGRRHLGEFQRAMNVGLDLRIYRAHWAERYERALEILTRLDQRTAQAIDTAALRRQHPVSDDSDTTEREQAEARLSDDAVARHGIVPPEES